jgi:glycerol kinase
MGRVYKKSSARMLLAIDQGTTSTRAVVLDEKGAIRSSAQREFPQIFPQPGWVEHDPADIWRTTLAVTRRAIKSAGIKAGQIEGLGIANQRETTIVWDRATGSPIHNGIVWQDRRTVDWCRKMRARVGDREIGRRTGLLFDPYFSASKIAWILDNVSGARSAARAGRLAFGTVDTFLLWRLTDGRIHATDPTNASRTMLYNLHTEDWDGELLREFRIPRSLMPDIRDSADLFGHTERRLFGTELPIRGVIGDQQAALVGQACFKPGMIKSTYGTGCFVVLNTGSRPVSSKHRLLTTVAYRLKGKTTFALEGSIFVAGAAIQWLRDELGIIRSAAGSAEAATASQARTGVYFVPAFTGLGAPYWDPDARGAIVGLTRQTSRNEIVRAALEAVAYQTRDLMAVMHSASRADAKLRAIRVDGGMARNDPAMQFLADQLQLTVQRPHSTETTVLGAAYIAGLGAGVFSSLKDIERIWKCEREYRPKMKAGERESLYGGWRSAVRRALSDEENR